VGEATVYWRKKKTFLSFKDRIQKLVKCWHKCVEAGEDYMENCLGTFVNKGYMCIPFFVSLKYLSFFIFYLAGGTTSQPKFI
jgi:hypothetical protein